MAFCTVFFSQILFCLQLYEKCAIGMRRLFLLEKIKEIDIEGGFCSMKSSSEWDVKRNRQYERAFVRS